MAIGTIGSGVPKQFSATIQIKNSFGSLIGFIISSTTAGTLTVYDNADGGTTNKIIDTITPAAGGFISMPLGFGNGLNVVVGGTISATCIYI